MLKIIGFILFLGASFLSFPLFLLIKIIVEIPPVGLIIIAALILIITKKYNKKILLDILFFIINNAILISLFTINGFDFLSLSYKREITLISFISTFIMFITSLANYFIAIRFINDYFSEEKPVK